MLKNYLLVFSSPWCPSWSCAEPFPLGWVWGFRHCPPTFVRAGQHAPGALYLPVCPEVLIWGYHKPLIGPICRFCINKGEKGGRALEAKAAAA